MLSYQKMMLAMASCVIAASCSNTGEQIYPEKGEKKAYRSICRLKTSMCCSIGQIAG